ncbi:MAG: hypothetical protein M1837_001175 [Sclerophora amabilis]|nr:MAG: hypothetical protein M1837_001175 [Sclerophora amabilis]
MKQDEEFFMSKEPLLPSRATEPSFTRPARRQEPVTMIQRFRRPFLAALLLVSFLYLGWTHWSRDAPAVVLDESKQSEEKPTEQRRIALEAHIMSKCPDAQDCLRDLVLPAMERVSDKVNFTLSFIGTPTHEDDGVACKHGPSECLGNMLELCAASLYPDPKTYLGFSMCLINDYRSIPQRNLVEDCSLEYGVDFEKLNSCVSSDDGYSVELLRKSVERSADAGVRISCTVRLDEKVRCVRDAREWKDCEAGSQVDDLVRDIEELYGKSAAV